MRPVLVFAASALLSIGAHAQAAAPAEDHVAHHPDGASAPASAPKKSASKPKSAAAKPKTPPPAASAASAAMGMGAKQKMHDEMHNPGGMHEQKHGKGGTMMQGGAMKGMPAASAASQ
jgi:hypothetical protein